jgi:hypothetical protein
MFYSNQSKLKETYEKCLETVGLDLPYFAYGVSQPECSMPIDTYFWRRCCAGFERIAEWLVSCGQCVEKLPLDSRYFDNSQRKGKRKHSVSERARNYMA